MRYAYRVKATALFVLVSWAAWIWASLTASPAEHFGVGLTSLPEVWRVFSSGLAASTLPAQLVATAFVVCIGGMSEWVLGSRHYVTLGVVFQMATALSGLMVADVLELLGSRWGAAMATELVLSPSAWLFGVAAVASARLGTLWRRRLRLILTVTAVSLVLYSGTALDIGRFIVVVLGAALAPRDHHASHTARFSLTEFRVLIALGLFAVGAGPTLAALNPASSAPLAGMRNLTWPTGEYETFSIALYGLAAVVFNQMPLVLYGVLSYGLLRGRRLAWWCAQATLLATIVALLFESAYLEDLSDTYLVLTFVLPTIIPWVVASVVLIAVRAFFRVHTPPEALRRLLIALPLLALGTVALWALLGATLDYEPRPELLHAWMRFLPPVLLSVIGTDVLPLTPAAWTGMHVPGVLFWLGLSALLFATFHASRVVRDDSAAMRAALTSGTGPHLAWMGLWPGNAMWRGDDGYVAYRVHHNVAVALGEPVVTGRSAGKLADAPTPPDSPASADSTAVSEPLDPVELASRREKLAREFEAYATHESWIPAWYCVGAEFGRQRGALVQVAEEAVVPTTRTSFKGKKFQDIRTARNHAARDGIRAVWTTWDEAGPLQREQIKSLSEAWVADKALPEMGFTLGGVRELQDPSVRLMLALDEEDRMHGVTSWLPVYEEGRIVGWMLDFMRRDAEGFRFVVEFLIAETLLHAQSEGLEWISLSGAPLVRSNPAQSADAELGGLEVILDKVGTGLEPLYGFRSLARFKSKFQPEHEPWYLAYADPAALPAIGLAISTAYLPKLSVVDFSRAVRTLQRSHQ